MGKWPLIGGSFLQDEVSMRGWGVCRGGSRAAGCSGVGFVLLVWSPVYGIWVYLVSVSGGYCEGCKESILGGISGSLPRHLVVCGCSTGGNLNLASVGAPVGSLFMTLLAHGFSSEEFASEG